MTVFDWLAGFITLALGAVAATHALLKKRRPRAAAAWVGLCLLVPVLGALLYFLFGVNRVRRHAEKLHHRWLPLPTRRGPERVAVPAGLIELVAISDAVSGTPLSTGNALRCLYDGEQAYPRMLSSIESAKNSLFLSSYIFDADRTGHRFVEALAAAAARGVDVRVLVDGVGELYSRPRIARVLRRRGIRSARFLPPRLLPPTLNINLRNHHKLLVADAAEAYTGGMNIGDRHLAQEGGCSDIHFRVAGPIVADLREIFLRDWEFATGESASATAAENPIAGAEVLARVVLSGPDENLDKLQTILVGAISAARREILIMTPYFLPPREMVGALQAAALRGVEVRVILPGRNNLPLVDWATRNMLWELLERGVRVLYQPPPFSHSKLFVVDRHYAQVGSANLDPRSLRLNFELNLEIFGKGFSEELAAHFDRTAAGSTEMTLAEIDARPFAVRVRDALAWLLTPYL